MGELLSTSLDPAERLLLVCSRGVRSHAAAEALRARGIGKVFSLRGGTEALNRTAAPQARV